MTEYLIFGLEWIRVFLINDLFSIKQTSIDEQSGTKNKYEHRVEALGFPNEFEFVFILQTSKT